MYQNLLRYGGGRYAWYALLILLCATIVFVSQPQVPGASGSTWQGYVLGGLSLVLVYWLAALGIRKRRYASAGLLQRWVSAHVYIGLVVVIVVLLHSGAELGWNVHGLAFVLLVITVLSGIFGCIVYLVVPGRLAEVRNGGQREMLFAELAQLNAACLSAAQQCTPATELAVQSSLSGTQIGGGVIAQLFALDRSTAVISWDTPDAAQVPEKNFGQQLLLEYLAAEAPDARTDVEVRVLTELVSIVARRQEVLRRVRQDVQLQGWLQFWLYLHIPTTVALLVALVIHVVVVFFHW